MYMIMELSRIERIVDKYFEGETTIEEERELQNYFSSTEVAPHLLQYVSIFKHFEEARKEHSNLETPIFKNPKTQKRIGKNNFYWVSIAASIVVVLGIGLFYMFGTESSIKNNELGTYDDPKQAFEATQKALNLLSNNVNVGIESVQYIDEYQKTKNRIFRTVPNPTSEF